MFDIYKYGEMLARNLKAVNHTDNKPQYYEATDQTELYELEQNISNASGTILIAIDGQMSGFTFDYDNLIEKPFHSIVVAKQTKATDARSITEAQQDCKQIIDQVIARMLLDAYMDKYECDKIDASTFTTQGFGPIGGVFYGVILSFSLSEGVNFTLKNDYWHDFD